MKTWFHLRVDYEEQLRIATEKENNAIHQLLAAQGAKQVSLRNLIQQELGQRKIEVGSCVQIAYSNGIRRAIVEDVRNRGDGDVAIRVRYFRIGRNLLCKHFSFVSRSTIKLMTRIDDPRKK